MFGLWRLLKKGNVRILQRQSKKPSVNLYTNAYSHAQAHAYQRSRVVSNNGCQEKKEDAIKLGRKPSKEPVRVKRWDGVVKS